MGILINRNWVKEIFYKILFMNVKTKNLATILTITSNSYSKGHICPKGFIGNLSRAWFLWSPRYYICIFYMKIIYFCLQVLIKFYILYITHPRVLWGPCRTRTARSPSARPSDSQRRAGRTRHTPGWGRGQSGSRTEWWTGTSPGLLCPISGAIEK